MATNIKPNETGAGETAPPVTPPAPVPAPEPAQPAEGSVTLSTEAFNALMKRLGDLETTQQQMFSVQDKDKIAKIEALRNSGKLVKSVSIRKHAGKYVVGWDKMVQNDVYKDESGRLVEKQMVSFWYEDGTKAQMTYREWGIAYELVAFEVTKESKDADGNLFFTCVGPDGKTIELNANFIN